MSGRWSAKDDAFLRRNYDGMSRGALKNRLGRTWLAIEKRALALGVNRDRLKHSPGKLPDDQSAYMRRIFRATNDRYALIEKGFAAIGKATL